MHDSIYRRSDRLLLVEDCRELAETIALYLILSGYDVVQVSSLQEARARLGDGAFDLIILDIELPDGDGRELLEELKTKTSPAVVVISGRAGEQDRISSLERGADDYLVKPLSLRELAARVCAILRRRREGRRHPAAGEVYQFGPFCLDGLQRSLTHRAVGEIALTTAQFDVLWCLVAAAPQIASRELLTQKGLGRAWQPLDRSIDQVIVSLRRKLDIDKGGADIVTVRGRGYLLRAREPDARRGTPDADAVTSPGTPVRRDP